MYGGKAINATELLAVNIYNTASVQNNMAIAQAKAVLFFIALAVISFIQTSMNFLKGTITGEKEFTVGSDKIAVPEKFTELLKPYQGKEIVLGIRPEDLRHGSNHQ